MLQLMMAKKELDTKPVLSLHQDYAKVQSPSYRPLGSSQLLSAAPNAQSYGGLRLCFVKTNLLVCDFSPQEVQNKVEQICEMGQVMRRAVQVDDQHYCSVRERLAQLEVRTWDVASSRAVRGYL